MKIVSYFVDFVGKQDYTIKVLMFWYKGDIMKDILSCCVRNKNISIHPSIEKVLCKAFVNTNANKLPDGSFSTLYGT